MMNSNAAAIKRRAPRPAGGDAPQVQPNISAQGLTLPQVIAIIDKRLINLETFMKDGEKQVASVNPVVNDNQVGEMENIKDVLEEYNNRFEMLAEEIGNMKDMLLKLQTYTMDVNKVLLDERIHVLSDFGNGQKNVIALQEVDVSSVELKDELLSSA